MLLRNCFIPFSTNKLWRKIVFTNFLLTSFLLLGQEKYRDSIRLKLKSIEVTTNDSLYISTLNEYARTFIQENNDSLLFYAELLGEKSRASHNILGQAMSFLNKGTAFATVGKFKEAEIELTKALRFGKTTNNSIILLKIYNAIALNNFLLKDYTKAFTYAQEGLKLAKEENNKEMIVLFNMNIGAIFGILEDNDVALPYFKEALKFADEPSQEFTKAMVNTNMARLYEKIDSLEIASNIVDLATSTMKQLGAKSWLSYNYITNAHIALKRDRLDKAADYLEKSNRLSKELEDNELLAENYLALSRLAIANSQLSIAKEHAKTAMVYAESANSIANRIIGEKLLYQIALEQNDTKAALTHLESYQKLSEFQIETNVHSKLLLLEATSRFQKDKQLVVETRTQQEEEQSNTLVIVGIILFCLLLLLFFGFWNHKRKIEENKKLDHVVSEKQKIFSIIGHDLTSPLNTLQQSIELYKSKYITEEDLRNTLDRMKGGINHSSFTLKNMQYWAKSQIGELKPDPTEINLEDILLQCISHFKSQMDEKNIELEYELARHYVVFDKEHLVVVLENLISNAIKFTPNSGKISLKIKTNNSNVIFSICDKGVGISATTLKEIREAEMVNPYPGTNLEKGTGIGLKTALILIDLNKTKYTIDSKINKGTCISLLFNAI